MGDEPDLGSELPASLLGLASKSVAGEKLEADLGRCAAPYMWAMFSGQMLEKVCRIAEPALVAPVDDDERARRVVDKGLRRQFNDAISRLTGIDAGQVEIDPDLADALHAARRRRNVLAHDAAWIITQRLIAGEVEEQIAELEAHAVECDRLREVLWAAVFGPAVEARGVTMEQVMSFADAVGAHMLLDPEHYEGAGLLPQLGGELLDRVEAVFDLSPEELRQRLNHGEEPL